MLEESKESIFVTVRSAIKQIIVIKGLITFANYIQNFIQHPAVKVTSYAEEIIGDYQSECQRNRSTTDHIFCIRQILEKNWEYNEAVHHLFIDFKKAYDSVRREVLCKILIEFGIPM